MISLSGLTSFASAQRAQVNSTLQRVHNVNIIDTQSTQATVQWKAVKNAGSYQLRLFQSSGTDAWQKIRLLTKIKQKSKTLISLEPETMYRVKVRAVRKAKRGKWSQTAAFTTLADEGEDDEEKNNEEGCKSNQTPVFSADITDLNYVADIVPPPSLSGTNLKTHSFLNTELNSVPVYAPIDGTLISGAYYLEGNPDGEYTLKFQSTCEITYIVDHITDPTDTIRAAFPDEPKDNTTDDIPSVEISLLAGDLIGYTTGTVYGIWDFGVYNSEMTNQFADDPNASDRDKTAVCPYDFYAADLRSQYYDLFARSEERDYPGAEEFCALEPWGQE